MRNLIRSRKSATADFFFYKGAVCGRRGMKEQKSPARGDFTPSEPSTGRRRLEAHESIPTSAEVGLRNFLKKVP
jgi:hypothetical protein